MMMIKMKKLRILFIRAEQDVFIRALIRLGCVEPSEADETAESAELTALADRVEVGLDQYQANKERLLLLGTEYTLLLTGWMPAPSESALISFMSEFTCAWDIEDPSPEEHEKVPVKMKYPRLFGKLYRGGGKLFSPLMEKAIL